MCISWCLLWANKWVYFYHVIWQFTFGYLFFWSQKNGSLLQESRKHFFRDWSLVSPSLYVHKSFSDVSSFVLFDVPGNYVAVFGFLAVFRQPLLLTATDDLCGFYTDKQAAISPRLTAVASPQCTNDHYGLLLCGFERGHIPSCVGIRAVGISTVSIITACHCLHCSRLNSPVVISSVAVSGIVIDKSIASNGNLILCFKVCNHGPCCHW